MVAMDHYEILDTRDEKQSFGRDSLWMQCHRCIARLEERSQLLEYISNLSRGFAQVVFLDNPISGLFIMAAIGIFQLKEFLYADVVTVSGWAFLVGLIGTLKRRGLNTGLYLYNSVLVGCAIGVFYSATSTHDMAFRFGSLIIFGIAAVGVQLILESVVPGSPIFTFPFNITMVIFLHLSYSGQWIDLPVMIGGVDSMNTEGNLDYSIYWNEIKIKSLLEGICNGFCQVYLVESWIAGVLMFVAMCVEDLELAALALLGSFQGSMMAISFGLPLSAVYAGLYGYNPLLVTMAVGKVFSSEYTCKQRWLLAIFFGFATFPIEASLKIILAKIHIPVMTFPFCVTTSFFFCIRNWVRQNPVQSEDMENMKSQKIVSEKKFSL